MGTDQTAQEAAILNAVCIYIWILDLIFNPPTPKKQKRLIKLKWQWLIPTWKAEDAVPKTKPFGKLALLICEEQVWIPNATSSSDTTKLAMPFLNSMV